MKIYILAIETSCDDTSVALLSHDGEVLDVLSQSQDESHQKFGGIVPEIASRRHTENLLPLVDQLFKRHSMTSSMVSAVVVTARPGLVGSLLVGVMTAKALGLAWGVPVVGVNHIEGHILAPFLRSFDYAPAEGFDFPFVSLVVSGGHTHLFLAESYGQYRLLGRTRDDAAGEAFDKLAKMMGLPYPGGPSVDQQAQDGDFARYPFPRGLRDSDSLDFSFSGLKSAARRLVEAMEPKMVERECPHICASFQEAVVDVLLVRIAAAAERTKVRCVSLTGGVSANSRLRSKALALAQDKGLILALPPKKFCTDNAAMIGLAGLWRVLKGVQSDWNLSPCAQSWESDFVHSTKPPA